MTQRDEYGRTELHYAAFDGPIDEVRIRIEQNADVNDRDNQQWTPLHFAAQMGRADVVALLLEAGAQVDALTEKGVPALHLAISAPRDPIATIRVLRSHGADATAATIKSPFGLRSPLYYLRETRNKPDIQAEFADLP
ncbi:MAG: ankyrin repeat domain-containing protein [Candidatus Nanopelagicales bacterium]